MKGLASLGAAVWVLAVAGNASAQWAPPGQPQVVWQTIDVQPGDYIAGGDGYGYCRQTGSYATERMVTEAAAGAIAVKILGWKGVAGALAAQFLAQMFQHEIRSAGGTGKEWFEAFGLVSSHAQCATVTLAVPDGARIVAIEPWAGDVHSGWQVQPCNRDGNGRYACQIGWSEWVFSQNGRVVTGIFKNWSHDRIRRATLGVKYMP